MITLLGAALGMEYIEKHVTNVFGQERVDWSAAVNMDMFNEIKKKMDTKIVLGGAHPTLDPISVLKNECIDFAIMGEGEYSFLELLNELGKKKHDFSKIKGIAYGIAYRM